MGRKSETEAQAQARARLKERHEAEASAHGEFIAIETRRDQLEAELAGLDHETAVAMAKWLDVSDAAAIGKVLDWSANRVRAAAKMAKSNDADSGEDDVHTAADVA